MNLLRVTKITVWIFFRGRKRIDIEKVSLEQKLVARLLQATAVEGILVPFSLLSSLIMN